MAHPIGVNARLSPVRVVFCLSSSALLRVRPPVISGSFPVLVGHRSGGQTALDKLPKPEPWDKLGLSAWGERLEPVVGVEPTTYGLRNRCSATELHWRGSGEQASRGRRAGKAKVRAACPPGTFGGWFVLPTAWRRGETVRLVTSAGRTTIRRQVAPPRPTATRREGVAGPRISWILAGTATLAMPSECMCGPGGRPRPISTRPMRHQPGFLTRSANRLSGIIPW
jgi:hypothetical protein